MSGPGTGIQDLTGRVDTAGRVLAVENRRASLRR